MSYQILFTKTAENDLSSALDYIEYVLKNPIAADHLLELTEEKISGLSEFPMAHPLVDDPVLQAWGVRFVTINNYIAFYIVKDGSVNVIRFLYEKRDWTAILKNHPWP